MVNEGFGWDSLLKMVHNLGGHCEGATGPNKYFSSSPSAHHLRTCHLQSLHFLLQGRDPFSGGKIDDSETKKERKRWKHHAQTDFTRRLNQK